MPVLADLVELARRGRHPQDIHTAAVVQAASGAVVDQLTVPATPAGYRRLLRLADRYDGWRVWAIESPGGDGAGLTRFLQAQGEQVVVELDRPSGPLAATAPSPIPGATRAAREAWPRPPRPAPSSRSPGGAVGAAGRPGFGGPGGHRRQRQLHALVVAAPGPLRGRLGNLTTPRLVVTCGRLRQQATGDVETAATTAATLRSLARRIHLLNPEVADHTRASSALVRTWRTGPAQPLRGGPDRGRHRVVRLVPSWPLRKRCRLRHAGRRRPDPGLQRPDGAGAAEPVRRPPAQPGPAPGRADRLRDDPATRADAQRRRAQGKTNREIRRCLVRYAARQLYRLWRQSTL